MGRIFERTFVERPDAELEGERGKVENGQTYAAYPRCQASSAALLLPYIDLWPRQLRTDLSNTHLTTPVTHLNTDIQRLAECQCTEETTGKHITSTVGVDDLVVCELWDGEGLWVGVRGGQVGFDGS
jgi:hypothetical protein